MRIAVASGKGGTGKTFVSTGLILIKGEGVLCDCDVEEPNSHIFLKPEIEEREDFHVKVPEVDLEKCTGCNLCFEKCMYKAILVMGKKVIFHPELCHSCGLCAYVCPEKAIKEVDRKSGIIEKGKKGKILFYHGMIDVGEAMSSPLIRELKKITYHHDFVIYDAPPGTSCPVIETIKHTDYIILVTEPTPFGLSDLEMAVKAFKDFEIPMGIVINKVMDDIEEVENFSKKHRVPIITEIPFDKKIAELYAQGIHPATEIPEIREIFEEVLKEFRWKR